MTNGMLNQLRPSLVAAEVMCIVNKAVDEWSWHR